MNTQRSSFRRELADGRATDRVRRHTAEHVNAKIDTLARAMVEDASKAGRDALVLRLEELDREWDVDRALMANFAIVGAVTQALGERYRGFRYLFRAQMGFLLLHAIAGWCPPLPLFRRLGSRTAKEISAERAALVERLAALPVP